MKLYESKNQVSVIQSDSVIIKLMQAGTALAEANTIQQTKKIVDVAAAAEIYAKRQQLGEEAIGVANTIKIEALRKLGEMLKATPKNTGAKGIGKSAVTNENHTPKLSELGLDKKTSAVAQKLASLPDAAFQQVRDGHETIAKAIAAVKETKPVKVKAVAILEPEKEVTPAEYAGDFGPDKSEIASSIADEQLLLEEFRRCKELDDPLAQALKDIVRYKAAARIAEERMNGMINEKTELVRMVKSLQAKLKRAGIK